MIRWIKFNIVGIGGAAVQIAALSLYIQLGVNYLLATALAVETAVLHNYVWHRHWTWRGTPGSLWRFQLSNGAVSILSNVILMRLFAALPVLPANLLAIACTSVLNYVLSARWVFSAQGPPHRLDGGVQRLLRNT